MNAMTPLNQQLGGVGERTTPSPVLNAPQSQDNVRGIGGASPYASTPTQAPAQGIGQEMAQQGRGPDSMLVHMAPDEVRGLQALAMAGGGSLTINPVTGLPEASFLKKMLPMLIGAVLTPLTGGLINPMTAGALVGAGYGIKTGSLKKGLMAGLSAYGGAGLSSAITGIGMAAAPGAVATAAPGAAAGAAPAGIVTAAPGIATNAALINSPATLAQGLAGTSLAPSAAAQAAAAAGQVAAPVANMAATQAAPVATMVGGITPTAGALPGASAMSPTGLRAIPSNFGDALRMGGAKPIPGTNYTLPGVPDYIPRAVTTGLGVTGLTSGLMNALTPGAPKSPKDAGGKSNYAGPYVMTPRKVRFPGADRDPHDSSEFDYFEDQPLGTPQYQTLSGGAPPGYPGYVPLTDAEAAARKKQLGYAEGGLVALKPGGFVLDARTVSEVGNGSSDAGQEALSRYGGQPINGRGDGVSDAINARIGRGRAARVARDEVKFSPEAVRKLGKGDQRRGAQRLYNLMEQAHVARAQARRGDDTGLRKGLGT